MELPGQGETFQHKYKLHEVLGKGGFAAVYRATDLEIGRDVAIKVLAPSEDGYSKGIESRFMREGRVIAGLQDPHTITMFEFGRSDDGLLFMVFEYVRGTDLSILVKRSALPEPAVAHIMRQVLQSLREAHAAGILHRDIKPANILIYEYMDDPYRAKLLDFGIAKPVAGDGLDITSDGAMIGTPRYMAPEQIYGGELGPTADIYSLGLVAYEMLVGKPAITGRTTKEMMVQQLSDTPVTLPPTVPVSPGMRNIINRMLTRDPGSRFASADAAIQALDMLRASGPQHGMAGSGPLQPMPGPQGWSSGAHPAPGAHSSGAHVAPGSHSSGAHYAPQGGATPLPHDAGYPNPTPNTARGVHPTWSNRQMRTGGHPMVGPTQPGPPISKKPNTMLLATVGLIAGAGIVGAVVLPDLLSGGDDGAAVPLIENTPTGLVRQDTGAAAPASQDVGVALDAASADAGAPDAAVASPLGCGLKAGWEQSREFSISVGSARRQFTVYLPKSYDKDREHPVVMLFHKAFNDARWMVKDTNIRPVADKEKFVVLAFDAAEKTQPWVHNDIEFVEAAVAETARAACIDRGRVFAVGHGGGGDFVYDLACAVPLAGISTAGHAPTRGMNECRASPAVPYIRLVGLDDNYNPPKGGSGCLGGNYKSIDEIELDWREKNSCGAEETTWFKKRRDVCATWECDTPFVSCRLEGGHDWPNSTPEKFEMPGCPHPPPDFPMMEKIWQFFENVEAVDGSRWRE